MPSRPSLAAFAQLSRLEQEILRVAAVCICASSKSELKRGVIAAGCRTDRGTQPNKEWPELMQGFFKEGWLRESRRLGICVPEPLSTQLALQAYEAGVYDQILARAFPESSFYNNTGKSCFDKVYRCNWDSYDEGYQMLRHSCLRRRRDLLSEALSEMRSRKSLCWNSVNTTVIWGEVFYGIEDPDLIRSCLGGVLDLGQVLAGKLHYCLEYEPEQLPQYTDHWQEIAQSGGLGRIFLVDWALLRGDIEALEQLSQAVAGPLAQALAQTAMILLQGEHEQMLNAYKKVLRLWRRESGQQRSHPPSLLFPLLVAWLFRYSCPEHVQHLQSWQSELAGKRSQPKQQELARMMQCLQQPGSLSLATVASLPLQKSPTTLRLAWHLWQILRPPACAEPGKRWLDRVRKAGLEWLAEDCCLAHPPSEEERIQAEQWFAQRQWRSPTLCLAPPPAWQRTLEGLRGIANYACQAEPVAEQAERRLIWHVSWLGEGQVSVDISALEQRRLAEDRWSKGRPIALKRLVQKKGELPSCDQQDQAIIACIQCEISGWYRNEYWFIDAAKALPLLIGHPRVMCGDPPRPLHIARSELHLDSQAVEGGHSLRLIPDAQTILANRGLVVHALAADRLCVMTVNKVQIHLAQLFQEGPVCIPEAELAGLRQTLERLSSQVKISGSIASQQDQAGGLQERAADSRPVCRIQGKLPLHISLVCEPEPAGVGYPAGRGPEHILQPRPEGTQVICRDLEQERQRRKQLLDSAPHLASALDRDDQAWIADPLEILEILDELRRAGDHIRVCMEQAELPRVVGSAGLENAHWQLKKNSRGWLQLGAEVRVNEDLVLDAASLLGRKVLYQGRFIALDEGRWVALEEDLRERLQDIASLAQPSRASSGKPLLHPWAALGIFADQPGVSGDAGWQHLLKELAQSPAAPLPNTLAAELRPYQIEGFRWLAQLTDLQAGACLADDMGLGKTVQTLALLLHRMQGGAALVVAPTSVCGTWEREAQRFAPSLRVHRFASNRGADFIEDLGAGDLLIVSYALLHQGRDILTARAWHTVILDEAHAIKNAQTQRAKAACALSAAARVALTGTPVENRLSDLHSIFNFLIPGLLGSAQHFAQHFSQAIERDGDRSTRNRLHRLLRPFLLRRSKAMVLQELPARTELRIEVDLSPEERAFYEALRQKAEQELCADSSDQQAGGNILAHLTHLRRACCHPRLVDPAADDCPSGKQQALMELLEELQAGGHRCLIFSQFVDHLQLIRRDLERAEISYLYLDGSTPERERQARVAAFQAGTGLCFLISLKAGGTGLTLTGADYVVHLDPWWNPAVEDQASDRAHRIGQSRPVTIYRLLVRDSIEEGILDLHERKRDLAADILDGSGQALSREDLLNLIRHRAV